MEIISNVSETDSVSITLDIVPSSDSRYPENAPLLPCASLVKKATQSSANSFLISVKFAHMYIDSGGIFNIILINIIH
jgi:hypothetical protein